MREDRPWGYYETILEEEFYKVKRLVIFSNKRISLQKHQLRDEFWVIVKGSGILDINAKKITAKSGDSFNIPATYIHRISNQSLEDLVIIETQVGICDENDIERLEDDWMRHKKEGEI